MPKTLKVLDVKQVTHNVHSYKLERPEGLEFTPGQATEIAIDKDGLREKFRPFTFTSLAGDDHIEFVIKNYFDHDGVTKNLAELKAGDSVLMKGVFGAIKYKGEGTFIAGGAGITPFIAILRMLAKDGAVGDNRLLFSNHTSKDVILENEFKTILGSKAIFTLTQEQEQGYEHGYINAEFLQKHNVDVSKPVYICGPRKMTKDINQTLQDLGASVENVVFEK